MLKKLLKYDWKFFWKVPAIINLALGVITLLGIVSLVSPIWDIRSNLIEALLSASLMFYYIAIFAGSIAVSVYVAVRFYRNLYTDEGYLTNTLPVTPRQIIISKLLISALWSFITGLVIVLSIVLLITVGGVVYADVNIFSIFYDLWREVLELFWDYGFHPLLLFFLLFVYIVVSTFFNILLIFAAISLGQLFSRHRVLGSIFWFFVEYVVIHFSSSILMSVITFNYFDFMTGMDGFFTFFNLFLCGSIILILIIGTGLYFLTEYMLKHRLDLD